jgi:sulfhydrogenase subunit beta (sulfur reductase)
MQFYILKKDRLNNLVKSLSLKNKVMAPVRKDDTHFAFQEVDDSSNIALKYIPTILPPKKYFMPQFETLVEYDNHKGQNMEAIVEYEDMVLFGVHTCDLAGIQCLNIVFSDRPRDINYMIRKNKITIIGLECSQPCDEFSTCSFMGNESPNGGYDLFFTDLGDYFYVHVNTQHGDDIIDSTGLFEKAESAHTKELGNLRDKKKAVFKNRFGVDHEDIPEYFEKSLESPIWEEIGGRCLSCGNCTNVCPTCYCFDIKDEPNLDLRTGKRIRVWDSCQNETFAKVSGGENFREKRSDRKRHRFYRKFKYPVERYSHFFCTGCGRCTRTCMAKISLIETLEFIIKENAQK